MAESPEFAALSQAIRIQGEPEEAGAVLKHTAHAPSVICRSCGVLPSETYRWSEDWLTLCQEARRHALENQHQVAVGLWNGAIYDGTGPVPAEVP